MAYYLVYKRNNSLLKGKVQKLKHLLKSMSFCDVTSFPLKYKFGLYYQNNVQYDAYNDLKSTVELNFQTFHEP